MKNALLAMLVLSGCGTEALKQCEIAPIDLGAVEVGEISTVRIPIDPRVSFDPQNVAAPFAVKQQRAFIEVSYSPTSLGRSTGSVLLQLEPTCAPFRTSLIGTAIVDAISLSTTAIDF